MGCLGFFPLPRDVHLKLWLGGGIANVTSLDLEIIWGIPTHTTSHQMNIWVASRVTQLTSVGFQAPQLTDKRSD